MNQVCISLKILFDVDTCTVYYQSAEKHTIQPPTQLAWNFSSCSFSYLLYISLSKQLYHTYPHRFWFWGQRWEYGHHNTLQPGVFPQVRDPAQSTPTNTVTIVTDILSQIKRHSAKLPSDIHVHVHIMKVIGNERNFIFFQRLLRGQGE